ncbi:MAG: orotate phosphoribosyltransferase [Candidatus Omnitrophica bacterium]|nr:orotate phosphoribosyltransferase [Candidatus Omnitrophota bacterium]
MKESEIIDIFKKSGALQKGHFELSSGLHSEQYFQCALVLQYPHYSELLCGELARHFAGRGIQAVIGPAFGGIIVAYEVARHLNCRAVFAERKEKELTLRRGFALGQNERVLLVEDVVTTGLSIRETKELIDASGASLEGMGAIVDRSPAPLKLGIPLTPLVKIPVETFLPEDCPLCAAGKPITTPGSRKK